MIVHVHVPLHRRSLSPDRIADHIGDLLDADHDYVQAVTVTDDDGAVLLWTASSAQ